MLRAAGKMRTVVLAAAFAGGLVVVPGPASAGGGGTCHDSKHVGRSGVTVDAKESCFFPTVLYVKEGTTVTWTNRDHVEHSVTGLAAAWGTKEDVLQQGQSVSVEFIEPGVYPYTCFLHPGMVGAVAVGLPTAAKEGDAIPSASVPIGRPAPDPGAGKPAPAAATGSAKSELMWPWLFAGLAVLAATGFLVLDALRGRRLRSIA